MRDRRVKALFRTCTAAQALQAWLGVFLNGALVLWCTIWLVFVAHDHAPGWPWLLAMLLPGLFLADLFSGLVHWGTDTWFDETQWCRVVSIAREHHIYPHHIVDYGVRDYLGYSCWPAALLIGPVVVFLSVVVQPSLATYLAVFLCGVVALCMVFGTYGHRLGHAPARSPVVRRLQRLRFLISPSYHKVHHSGNHDIRYCVINGWANAVCDRIGFWRRLEMLVTACTGSVPRRNDAEWFHRFADDPRFMTDPVPSLLKLRLEASLDQASHPARRSS